MKLVLLTHPAFFGTVSQPRFAEMIARGMLARGHAVEQWTAPARLSRLPVPSAFFRKWLGYADQYLVFPRELRRRIAAQPADTVFVVTDQALGIWVPPLAHRPHVIHCHDFLALRAALGEFPEQTVSRSGRQYQRLIRHGFSQGRAFISVSEKTRNDLHRFLPCRPPLSSVVYNGLNYPFAPLKKTGRDGPLGRPGPGKDGRAAPSGAEGQVGRVIPCAPPVSGLKSQVSGLLPTARSSPLAASLAFSFQLSVSQPFETAPGYLLHVGGNQWYKNRRGVLEIYRALVAGHPQPPALWLVGAPPSTQLRELAASVPAPGRVQFLTGLDNAQVNAAYAGARALVFPSLEEGFGWPIAEAMAAGCPVITTDAAPMTEVAGGAARLLPRLPSRPAEHAAWAQTAAAVVAAVLQMSPEQRAAMIQRGFQNVQRFDPETALNAYAEIYARVLSVAQSS